jgi:excisionase family DNA binding protein
MSASDDLQHFTVRRAAQLLSISLPTINCLMASGALRSTRTQHGASRSPVPKTSAIWPN